MDMQIVLAPVLTIGIAPIRFVPKAIARIAPIAPPVVVVMGALTCAVVISQAQRAVKGSKRYMSVDTCYCLIQHEPRSIQSGLPASQDSN
jgi:hypothetical protein